MNAVKLFFVSFARVLILTRPSRDESLEFRLTGGHQRGFSIFIESVNKVNTYPPQFFQLTGGHQRGFSIFLESVNKASTYPPQLLRLTGGPWTSPFLLSWTPPFLLSCSGVRGGLCVTGKCQISSPSNPCTPTPWTPPPPQHLSLLNLNIINLLHCKWKRPPNIFVF